MRGLLPQIGDKSSNFCYSEMLFWRRVGTPCRSLAGVNIWRSKLSTWGDSVFCGIWLWWSDCCLNVFCFGRLFPWLLAKIIGFVGKFSYVPVSISMLKAFSTKSLQIIKWKKTLENSSLCNLLSPYHICLGLSRSELSYVLYIMFRVYSCS